MRCPGCSGELAFESFGVWKCAACGRFDADGSRIVDRSAAPEPFVVGPAPAGAPVEPDAGVPPNVVAGLLSVGILAWIGAHVYVNTRDGVLDREDIAYIAGRTLVLPLVIFYYRSRRSMGGSGWFLAAVVCLGMIASVVPGADRIGAGLVIASAIWFLGRRKDARDRGE